MSKDPIQDTRVLINQFKKAYLEVGQTGGAVSSDTKAELQSLENLDEAERSLRDLYLILHEVVMAGGRLPSTTDINKRAIYTVFEKAGIFPALRKNPELKDDLLHYLKLDLITYVYTYKPDHIDKLVSAGISPNINTNMNDN
jgi:hypothetical protein